MSEDGDALRVPVTGNILRLAIGATAGAGLGWVAWLVSRQFVNRYRVVLPDDPATQASARGSTPAKGLLQAAAATAGMAAWGGYAAVRADGAPQAVSAMVMAALLLAISLVDFRVRRIPDALVGTLLGWAIVQIAWIGTPRWRSAALGLLVGGGIFLLLAFITRWTMGMGDVKLMAASGALVGFPLITQAILWGVVAGGVAALMLLMTGRVRRKDPIAYGPYLALGTWLITAKVLGLWG